MHSEKNHPLFHPVTALALGMTLVLALAFPALAATVTTTNDSGAGSLREAIAGTSLTGQTIDFDIGSSNTITLMSRLPSITTAMDNLTIDGTNNGYGVILDGNGDVQIFNPSFDNGTITLQNLTLQNASASSSSGIASSGGAISAFYATDLLTINTGAGSTVFRDNSARNYGGAIYANNALTINTTGTGGVTFSGNSTTSTNYGHGGAIYTRGALTLGGNVNFGLEDDAGSGNKAQHGGAIYLAITTNTLDATAGHVGFYHNAAANTGGAIYASGSLNITTGTDGMTFSRNSATAWGGAIYVGGELDLGGGIDFGLAGAAGSGNSAYSGGAIYFASASATTLTATAGHVGFYNNEATYQGGAIHAFQALTINTGTDGMTFNGNSAGTYGGAIRANNALTINTGTGGVTFSGNSTTSDDGSGGAIYAQGGLTLGGGTNFGLDADTDSGNTSARDGGAIYFSTTANTLAATAGHVGFYHNKAARYGGAIRTDAALTITTGTGGMTFSGNSAGSYGGAILAIGALAINTGADGVVFSGNSAGQYGGAIYANNTLTITTGTGGMTFSGNSAGSFGGGAILAMGALNIGGNALFENNTAATYGGAIWAAGDITLDTGTAGDIHFTGNTANSAANAIHMGNSLMTLAGDKAVVFDDPLSRIAEGSVNSFTSSAWLAQFSGDSILSGTSGGGQTGVTGGEFRILDGAVFDTGGTSASASFSLSSGATLSGAGTVRTLGDITLEGTIDPTDNRYTPDSTSLATTGVFTTGNDIATLSLQGGTVVLNGATLNIDTAAGNVSDKIAVTGNADFTGGGKNTVKVNNFLSGDYLIADWTGTLTGSVADDFNAVTGGSSRVTATLEIRNSDKELWLTIDTTNGTLTWTGNTNDAWANNNDTLTNWTGDYTYFANGDTVIFNADGNSQLAVDVDMASVTVAGMTVSYDGYSFSGGKITGGTLSLDATSTSTTTFGNEIDFAGGITVAAENTLAFDYATAVDNANEISGTGNLKKQGAGTLTLTGSIAETIDIEIVGGTLELEKTGAYAFNNELTGSGTLIFDLGDAANALTFGSNVGTAFTGMVQLAQGTLDITTTAAAALESATLQLDAAGTAVVSSGRTLNNLTFNGGTLEIQAFTGTGAIEPTLVTVNALDATGGGAVKIDLATLNDIRTTAVDYNTFYDYDDDPVNYQKQLVAATTVTGGGTLSLLDQNGNDLTSEQAVIRKIMDGTSQTGNATFDFIASVDDSGNNKGIYLGYGLKEIEALASKTVVLDSSDSTSASPEINAKLTGSGGFIFTGSKDAEVGNVASDYTGATTVDGMTVTMTTNNAFGATSSFELKNNGKVDMNGMSQTVGGLVGSVGTEIDIGDTNGIGLTVNQSTNTDFAGILTGDGSLTKGGGGNLILSGANTYTGNTTINAGSLVVTGSLGNGAYNGAIANVGSLTFDQAGNQALSGVISGAGRIAKSGGGTLTLSANSSGYTGTFTQSAGTVALTGSAELGGTFTQNGGTFTSTHNTTLGAATFKGAVTPTGTLNVASATFDGATIDLGLLTGNNLIDAAGSVSFANNTEVIIDSTGASGTYTLIDSAGITGQDNVAVSDIGGSRGGHYFDANALKYAILSGTATLTWAGTASANIWNDDVSANTIWTAGAAKTWFKNGDNVIFDSTAANKNVVVAPGGVIVDSMTVNDSYNFSGGQITAGAVTVAAGNTLGLSIADVAPALDATSVAFNGSALNITGYTPGTVNPYNSPVNVETVIRTTGGVTGFNPLVTVAGQANADFLAASAYLDGNDVKVETRLRWYSTDPDRKAHGTFTIADGNTFILGTVLADNDTSPNLAAGWDGKTLAKEGAGTLILDGANTYSGGTSLNVGRIDLGHDAALGAGRLDMADGTTLGFGANNLSAANVIATTGTAVLDTGTNAATLSGVISGSGKLIKNGDGILTLSGANTFSGETAVTAGTLALGNVNSAALSTVFLNAGAALDIAGAGGNAALAGLEAVVGSILTTGGNRLDLTNNKTLTLHLAGAVANDMSASVLTVTGNGLLVDTTTKVSLKNVDEEMKTREFVVLASAADGAVTTDKLWSGRVEYILMLDAGKLLMQIAGVGSFVDATNEFLGSAAPGNSNIHSGGVYLDWLLTQPYADTPGMEAIENYFIDITDNLTPGAGNRELRRFYGAYSAYANRALQDDADRFRRIWQKQNHSFLDGFIFADLLPGAATAGVASDSGLASPLYGARDCVPHGQTRVWASGFGTWSEQDSRSGRAGYDYDSYGVALGLEHTRDRLKLGIAAAYSRGDLEVDELGYENKPDVLNLALYGAYVHDSGFYAEGGLGYGHAWNDYHANMLLGGRKTGDYGSDILSADLELGYIARLACGYNLIPSVGIEYDYIRNGSWTEKASNSAAPANRFASGHDHALDIPIGLRANKAFTFGNDNVIVPEVRASYVYTANKSTPTIQSSFIGAPGTTTMRGVAPGRSHWRFGAGFSGQINRHVDFHVEYEFETRSGYKGHNLNVSAGLSF